MQDFRLRHPRWPLAAIGLGLLALVAVLVAVPFLEHVDLRTGGRAAPNGLVGCDTDNTVGELVPDPVAGTAIVQDAVQGGVRLPVIWPPGYNGRRAWDGQVEVLNQNGTVVARTGTRIQLLGGYDPGGWLTCYDGVFPA